VVSLYPKSQRLLILSFSSDDQHSNRKRHQLCAWSTYLERCDSRRALPLGRKRRKAQACASPLFLPIHLPARPSSATSFILPPVHLVDNLVKAYARLTWSLMMLPHGSQVDPDTRPPSRRGSLRCGRKRKRAPSRIAANPHQFGRGGRFKRVIPRTAGTCLHFVFSDPRWSKRAGAFTAQTFCFESNFIMRLMHSSLSMKPPSETGDDQELKAYSPRFQTTRLNGGALQSKRELSRRTPSKRTTSEGGQGDSEEAD
jgi:hypothetical protein